MTAHISLAGVGLLVLKSSLVLGFGWCVTRLLQRASAAVRHLVWLTVIVGVLFLPLVSEIAPVPFRVLPAVAAPQMPSAGAFNVGDRAPTFQLPSMIATVRPESPAGSTSTVPRFDAARALIALWAFVALVLSLRMIAGMISVSRLARRATPLVSGDWTQVLAEAADRIDVNEKPRLLMSDQVDMAFAFHAASPAIIVPGSAREWSNDRRRAVLLHELAHIQRRDLWSHVIAGFVCALNWFNPFIWAAARQLRIESEMASDEMVLRAGVRPSVYAQHLLDMVTGFGRRAPAVALAMARPKEFEGRLVAILDPERRRASILRNRSAVIGLVALPAFGIGAVAPVPKVPAVTTPVLTFAPRPQPVEPVVAKMVPAPRVASVAPKRVRTEATVTLSRDAVAMLVRFGPRAVVNPMMILLRDADSLKLSGPQADSIATLNRQYMIQLNRIWSPVSAFYAGRMNDATPLLPPPGSDPTRATIQALSAIVRDVDGLLTPEQRDRLAPNVRAYLDARRVPALVAATPNGVVMSLDQLNGVRGRGRGGG